jgi:hypothetical protein
VAERGEWYLFVDGENLTARGENLFHDREAKLVDGRYWQPGTYLWLPQVLTGGVERFDIGFRGMRALPRSAFYYTTAGGDQEPAMQLTIGSRHSGSGRSSFRISRRPDGRRA